ncbi:flavin reductase family protein [Candidatus Ruminimicrobium bovinum]|uniref:flavin reductase family protein n=1 Tax=Candidatus Ruminimicrobium bovinum TaxID=3242779 RepID=UPI0039B9A96C
MRKNFGQQTWFYPMPVLIVAAYDEHNKANAMNAAWGGIYDYKKVIICLDESHKTTKNIKIKKAFTISFADVKHVKECDYLGIVSGNDISDKIEKAGFSITKSSFVDAPVINELPMTLECNLLKFDDNGNIIGEIVNVSAKEEILNDKGQIDPLKLQPISYDGVGHKYLKISEIAGTAFSDGKAIK